MAKKKVKAPPFVMIRRDILKDPKWQKLSSGAMVVWIYLRAKFNYKTLSEVTLTYSEMEGVMTSKPFKRALEELMNEGWIKKTKQGGMYGGVCKYKFIGKYKDFFYQGRRI